MEWWNDTQAVVIKTDNQLILLGELIPAAGILKDKEVKKGELIGYVKPVLKKDKGRPMSMLHFEIYKKDLSGTLSQSLQGYIYHGVRDFDISVERKDKQPEELLDPTQYLIDCYKL